MNIVVRNWDKFQHADVTKRGRAPAWIKLYTEILSDENYLQLTPTRRAMLIGIWVEYARTRRALPDDTASLSRRLNQRVLRKDLEALNQAGYIELRQDNDTPLSGIEERRGEKDVRSMSTGDAAVGPTTSSGFDPDELAQWREPEESNVVELRPKPGLEVNGRPVSSRELLERFVENRPP